MKNTIHCLLIPVGFVFLPFLWLGLVLSGCKITLVEFYLEFFNHLKSKEPFGIFDDNETIVKNL